MLSIRKAHEVAKAMQEKGFSFFNSFSAALGFRYSLSKATKAERQAFGIELARVMAGSRPNIRNGETPKNAIIDASRLDFFC